MSQPLAEILVPIEPANSEGSDYMRTTFRLDTPARALKRGPNYTTLARNIS